ncbi:MAG TPA: phosphonate ABC transporter substrate-binding protein [Cyanobacteria bacterium UBA11371]|nr:phosphonate ABC transporter substrate-binding protein [Cyanobacteria bacterium UBA11371]HBE34456.1 phosphonate ABC transporter substrate-binding protein [Cyanobacteria bacterium UBA11368]
MRRRNLLLYSLLFIAGCTSVTNIPTVTQPKKLRFTVTDALGMEELQRDYGALQAALKEILQTEIELVPVESYTAAASALQSDQLDFVLTGPSEYVVMRARTNAVPVIGITRPNYRTVICVSANSKIKSLADLKGKKIALWKIGSTSGYLGPTKLLIDAGLNPQSDLKILMLGSKGLPSLQKGEVDAWGGSAVKYEQFLQEQGLSQSTLPVIAKGPLLPKDLFVASSQLNPEAVKLISSLLIKEQEKIVKSLSFVEEGKYKTSSLVPVNDDEYDMIRDVYKAIGQGNFVQ